MIERDIEKAVIARVKALAVDGLQVVGMWQASAAGIVRGLEGADFTAALSVAAKPKTFQTFSLPTADIPVSLTLSVRAERAPDGDALHDFTAPVAALLDDWQASIASVKTDFTLSNFNPCGFRLDGGEVSFDRNATAWVVTQSFTLRGIVKKS